MDGFHPGSDWGRMPAMNTDRPNTPAPEDPRREWAHRWLSAQAEEVCDDWSPIQGDASYRRYFRVRVNGESRILMDSPPNLENASPFVDIAGRLRAAGLHAPEIFLADLEAGFLLLEDLGDALFRDLIDDHSVDALFAETFSAMAQMVREVSHEGLPAFDRDSLRGELNGFTRYYLDRERGHIWNSRQHDRWDAFCAVIVESAAAQPQRFVHRDIHSCNLIKTGSNSPGIIDFQDAVRGPVSYDFVSLVWDRYFSWPRERLEQWMEEFRRLAAPDVDPETWRRWCDLMGLQRNLKIVGRFALLKHEQGKSGYVEMIPRFYRHILEVLALYPEFEAMTAQLGDPACAP